MGVSPCFRSSRATNFSFSAGRLPVRTLPSLATARKKKVAIMRASHLPQRRRDAEANAENTFENWSAHLARAFERGGSRDLRRWRDQASLIRNLCAFSASLRLCGEPPASAPELLRHPYASSRQRCEPLLPQRSNTRARCALRFSDVFSAFPSASLRLCGEA